MFILQQGSINSLHGSNTSYVLAIHKKSMSLLLHTSHGLEVKRRQKQSCVDDESKDVWEEVGSWPFPKLFPKIIGCVALEPFDAFLVLSGNLKYTRIHILSVESLTLQMECDIPRVVRALTMDFDQCRRELIIGIYGGSLLSMAVRKGKDEKETGSDKAVVRKTPGAVKVAAPFQCLSRIYSQFSKKYIGNPNQVATQDVVGTFLVLADSGNVVCVTSFSLEMLWCVKRSLFAARPSQLYPDKFGSSFVVYMENESKKSSAENTSLIEYWMPPSSYATAQSHLFDRVAIPLKSPMLGLIVETIGGVTTLPTGHIHDDDNHSEATGAVVPSDISPPLISIILQNGQVHVWRPRRRESGQAVVLECSLTLAGPTDILRCFLPPLDPGLSSSVCNVRGSHFIPHSPRSSPQNFGLFTIMGFYNGIGLYEKKKVRVDEDDDAESFEERTIELFAASANDYCFVYLHVRKADDVHSRILGKFLNINNDSNRIKPFDPWANEIPDALAYFKAMKVPPPVPKRQQPSRGNILRERKGPSLQNDNNLSMLAFADQPNSHENSILSLAHLQLSAVDPQVSATDVPFVHADNVLDNVVDSTTSNMLSVEEPLEKEDEEQLESVIRIKVLKSKEDGFSEHSDEFSVDEGPSIANLANAKVVVQKDGAQPTVAKQRINGLTTTSGLSAVPMPLPLQEMQKEKNDKEKMINKRKGNLQRLNSGMLLVLDEKELANVTPIATNNIPRLACREDENSVHDTKRSIGASINTPLALMMPQSRNEYFDSVQKIPIEKDNALNLSSPAGGSIPLLSLSPAHEGRKDEAVNGVDDSICLSEREEIQPMAAFPTKSFDLIFFVPVSMLGLPGLGYNPSNNKSNSGLICVSHNPSMLIETSFSVTNRQISSATTMKLLSKEGVTKLTNKPFRELAAIAENASFLKGNIELCSVAARSLSCLLITTNHHAVLYDLTSADVGLNNVDGNDGADVLFIPIDLPISVPTTSLLFADVCLLLPESLSIAGKTVGASTSMDVGSYVFSFVGDAKGQFHYCLSSVGRGSGALTNHTAIICSGVIKAHDESIAMILSTGDAVAPLWRVAVESSTSVGGTRKAATVIGAMDVSSANALGHSDYTPVCCPGSDILTISKYGEVKVWCPVFVPRRENNIRCKKENVFTVYSIEWKLVGTYGVLPAIGDKDGVKNDYVTSACLDPTCLTVLVASVKGTVQQWPAKPTDVTDRESASLDKDCLYSSLEPMKSYSRSPIKSNPGIAVPMMTMHTKSVSHIRLYLHNYSPLASSECAIDVMNADIRGHFDVRNVGKGETTKVGYVTPKYGPKESTGTRELDTFGKYETRKKWSDVVMGYTFEQLKDFAKHSVVVTSSLDCSIIVWKYCIASPHHTGDVGPSDVCFLKPIPCKRFVFSSPPSCATCFTILCPKGNPLLWRVSAVVAGRIITVLEGGSKEHIVNTPEVNDLSVFAFPNSTHQDRILHDVYPLMHAVGEVFKHLKILEHTAAACTDSKLLEYSFDIRSKWCSVIDTVDKIPLVKYHESRDLFDPNFHRLVDNTDLKTDSTIPAQNVPAVVPLASGITSAVGLEKKISQLETDKNAAVGKMDVIVPREVIDEEDKDRQKLSKGGVFMSFPSELDREECLGLAGQIAKPNSPKFYSDEQKRPVRLPFDNYIPSVNVDGYGSMMSYSETSSTVTSDGNEFVREPSEMVLEHNLNLNSPAYFFHDGGLSGSSHASSVDVADKSVTLEVSDILEQNAEELQNEEIDANVIIPKDCKSAMLRTQHQKQARETIEKRESHPRSNFSKLTTVYKSVNPAQRVTGAKSTNGKRNYYSPVDRVSAPSHFYESQLEISNTKVVIGKNVIEHDRNKKIIVKREKDNKGTDESVKVTEADALTTEKDSEFETSATGTVSGTCDASTTSTTAATNDQISQPSEMLTVSSQKSSLKDINSRRRSRRPTLRAAMKVATLGIVGPLSAGHAREEGIAGGEVGVAATSDFVQVDRYIDHSVKGIVPDSPKKKTHSLKGVTKGIMFGQKLMGKKPESKKPPIANDSVVTESIANLSYFPDGALTREPSAMLISDTPNKVPSVHSLNEDTKEDSSLARSAAEEFASLAIEMEKNMSPEQVLLYDSLGEEAKTAMIQMMENNADFGGSEKVIGATKVETEVAFIELTVGEITPHLVNVSVNCSQIGTVFVGLIKEGHHTPTLQEFQDSLLANVWFPHTIQLIKATSEVAGENVSVSIDASVLKADTNYQLYAHISPLDESDDRQSPISFEGHEEGKVDETDKPPVAVVAEGSIESKKSSDAGSVKNPVFMMTEFSYQMTHTVFMTKKERVEIEWFRLVSLHMQDAELLCSVYDENVIKAAEQDKVHPPPAMHILCHASGVSLPKHDMFVLNAYIKWWIGGDTKDGYSVHRTSFLLREALYGLRTTNSLMSEEMCDFEDTNAWGDEHSPNKKGAAHVDEKESLKKAFATLNIRPEDAEHLAKFCPLHQCVEEGYLNMEEATELHDIGLEINPAKPVNTKDVKMLDKSEVFRKFRLWYKGGSVVKSREDRSGSTVVSGGASTGGKSHGMTDEDHGDNAPLSVDVEAEREAEAGKSIPGFSVVQSRLMYRSAGLRLLGFHMAQRVHNIRVLVEKYRSCAKLALTMVDLYNRRSELTREELELIMAAERMVEVVLWGGEEYCHAPNGQFWIQGFKPTMKLEDNLVLDNSLLRVYSPFDIGHLNLFAARPLADFIPQPVPGVEFMTYPGTDRRPLCPWFKMNKEEKLLELSLACMMDCIMTLAMGEGVVCPEAEDFDHTLSSKNKNAPFSSIELRRVAVCKTFIAWYTGEESRELHPEKAEPTWARVVMAEQWEMKAVEQDPEVLTYMRKFCQYSEPLEVEEIIPSSTELMSWEQDNNQKKVSFVEEEHNVEAGMEKQEDSDSVGSSESELDDDEVLEFYPELSPRFTSHLLESYENTVLTPKGRLLRVQLLHRHLEYILHDRQRSMIQHMFQSGQNRMVSYMMPKLGIVTPVYEIPRRRYKLFPSRFPNTAYSELEILAWMTPEMDEDDRKMVAANEKGLRHAKYADWLAHTAERVAQGRNDMLAEDKLSATYREYWEPLEDVLTNEVFPYAHSALNMLGSLPANYDYINTTTNRYEEGSGALNEDEFNDYMEEINAKLEEDKRIANEAKKKIADEKKLIEDARKRKIEKKERDLRLAEGVEIRRKLRIHLLELKEERVHLKEKERIKQQEEAEAAALEQLALEEEKEIELLRGLEVQRMQGENDCMAEEDILAHELFYIARERQDMMEEDILGHAVAAKLERDTRKNAKGIAALEKIYMPFVPFQFEQIRSGIKSDILTKRKDITKGDCNGEDVMNTVDEKGSSRVLFNMDGMNEDEEISFVDGEDENIAEIPGQVGIWPRRKASFEITFPRLLDSTAPLTTATTKENGKRSGLRKHNRPYTHINSGEFDLVNKHVEPAAYSIEKTSDMMYSVGLPRSMSDRAMHKAAKTRQSAVTFADAQTHSVASTSSKARGKTAGSQRSNMGTMSTSQSGTLSPISKAIGRPITASVCAGVSLTLSASIISNDSSLLGVQLPPTHSVVAPSAFTVPKGKKSVSSVAPLRTASASSIISNNSKYNVSSNLRPKTGKKSKPARSKTASLSHSASSPSRNRPVTAHQDKMNASIEQQAENRGMLTKYIQTSAVISDSMALEPCSATVQSSSVLDRNPTVRAFRQSIHMLDNDESYQSPSGKVMVDPINKSAIESNSAIHNTATSSLKKRLGTAISDDIQYLQEAAEEGRVVYDPVAVESHITRREQPPFYRQPFGVVGTPKEKRPLEEKHMGILKIDQNHDTLATESALYSYSAIDPLSVTPREMYQDIYKRSSHGSSYLTLDCSHPDNQGYEFEFKDSTQPETPRVLLDSRNLAHNADTGDHSERENEVEG